MLKDWNIDRLLLFFLPLLFLISLVWMTDELVLPASSLILSILFYIFLTYKDRLVLGFSGIRVASIPSSIIATYTVFIAVPSIYILAIKDDPSEIPFFVSVILFYFLFPAGMYIARLLRPIHNKDMYRLFTQIEYENENDPYFFEVLVVILSLSIMILIGYLLRVDEIPIFQLLRDPGNSARYFLMREEALKLLGITKVERYLFFWLRSFFVPFGIVGSLHLATQYKKKKYILLFILFLIFGLFTNSITLEKSPIASIFLSIATYILIRKKDISLKLVISFISIILAGPILITYLLIADRQGIFEIILWSYLIRIFQIPAEALFHYFNIFPDIHPFLLGRSSQLFSWLYIDGTFPISNYVASIWWKDPFTTGFANANYLGSYWADFGWIGIIISTFALGMIVYFLQWKILEVCKYKISIIYFICAAICVPNFTFAFFSTAFTRIFFTRGLILLILFLFVYEYVIKISQRYKRRSYEMA